MKNYAQVYVRNSLEAAEWYCDAFGAEVTFAIRNPENTAYEHCELSVNGEGFLALSEAARVAAPNASNSAQLQNQSKPPHPKGAAAFACPGAACMV